MSESLTNDFKDIIAENFKENIPKNRNKKVFIAIDIEDFDFKI